MRKRFKNNREDRSTVCCCSRGQATRVSPILEILAVKASSLARKGVSLSTIGVGTDFNEDLLISLRRPVAVLLLRERLRNIPGVFNVELKGLLSGGPGNHPQRRGPVGVQGTECLDMRRSHATGATLTLPTCSQTRRSSWRLSSRSRHCPLAITRCCAELDVCDACHNCADQVFSWWHR